MSKQFFVRIAGVTTLLMGLVYPFLLWTAAGTLKETNNDPRSLVPKELPERQTYEWFLERFGSGETIVIAWDGASIDDERFDRLEEELVAAEIPTPNGSVRPFERVESGRNVVQQLTARPLSLSREEVIRRLRGTLVGADGKTCAAVAFLTPGGIEEREATVRLATEIASRVAGVEPEELHLGGPVVEGVRIDEAALGSFYDFGLFSTAVVVALAWYCLGTFRLLLPNLFVSGFAASFSLAIVAFSGAPMNGVLIVLPTLIFVVGISCGIHLANYFVKVTAPQSNGQSTDSSMNPNSGYEALRMLQVGWLPCFLAMGTTAIGLFSLYTTNTVAIRDFGFFGTISVLVALAGLFLVLPGGFVFLNPPGSFTSDRPAQQPAVPNPRGQFWWIVPDLVLRLRLFLLVTIIGLTILLALGVSRLETSVKLETCFRPDSVTIRDYRWLEEQVGPLMPIEIVIRFPKDCRLSTLDRLGLIRSLEKGLATVEDAGGTMSAATFGPELPTNDTERAMLASLLEQRRADFAKSKYFFEENGEQLWRITVRTAALKDIDYGAFVERLREHLAPQLAAWSGPDFPSPPELILTGILPLINQAQKDLMLDLGRSYLSSLVAITIVTVLVLRNLAAGVLTMIPNVLPTLWVFGSMGWMGAWVDIGSMMTASIALGLTIDATYHYLVAFRRAAATGATREEAVRAAYRQCGPAMTYATLVCGLGMLVFALSDFPATNRFSVVLVSQLFLTLIGSLVLLPAMLAGPLGVLFVGRSRSIEGDQPIE